MRKPTKPEKLGTDFVKIDARVITAEEYDKLPELTDADLARGTWKITSSLV